MAAKELKTIDFPKVIKLLELADEINKVLLGETAGIGMEALYVVMGETLITLAENEVSVPMTKKLTQQLSQKYYDRWTSLNDKFFEYAVKKIKQEQENMEKKGKEKTDGNI